MSIAWFQDYCSIENTRVSHLSTFYFYILLLSQRIQITQNNYTGQFCVIAKLCKLQREVFRALGSSPEQKKWAMIRLGFELLVDNWFSAYLTLFIKCTGYIWFNVDSREWTGSGRMTRPQILSETAGVRVADLTWNIPNMKQGCQLPKRDVRYMMSSSSVIRCVAQPVQWLKQGFFPFTINYVQIECGPFSLLPGGYWGSCPSEKQPERENSHSPHLVSVRHEKLQPSTRLCNSPCSCDNFSSKQGTTSTFRLATMSFQFRWHSL